MFGVTLPLRFHAKTTWFPLRFHLDFILVSRRPHIDLTPMSLRSQLNFIYSDSTSHFDFTSVTLGFHLGGFTLISHRVHFDLTSVSFQFDFNHTLASIKTPTNHSQRKASGTVVDGDQRHRSDQRNPQRPSKTNGCLPIPARTHPGLTRDALSFRGTTFHLISQDKVKHQPKRARLTRPRSTYQTLNPHP